MKKKKKKSFFFFFSGNVLIKLEYSNTEQLAMVIINKYRFHLINSFNVAILNRLIQHNAIKKKSRIIIHEFLKPISKF